MFRNKTLFFVIALVLVGAAAALAQRDFSKVEIKTQKVAEGIYLLQGSGGNLGLCAGPDDALLIDDQFAPLSEKIQAAVAKVNPKGVRFLLNTHWHGDHAGGNENFAKTGVAIFAHDNVRARMSREGVNAFGPVPASPYAALPVCTFSDSLTFHLNGQTITCFHMDPAHTDGDAVVWFREANVIHTGDCLFNGTYAVIDVPSGGSIGGMIRAEERIMALAGPETQIIPGHGPLASRKDLEAARDMLVTVRDRVAKLVTEGKTLEEIQAAKPLADLDARWGQGGIKADMFLSFVVADLSRK